MPSPDWNDDDVLMGELSQAVAAAEADRRVIAAASGVFAWRTAFAELELELLELTSDSLLERELAVRDGGGSRPRIITFDDGETGVELEIGDRGIVGQLIPPGPGTVELLCAAGTLGSVEADEVGCFAFDAVFGSGLAGPIRVRIRSGGRSFVTDWVVARPLEDGE
jgi:hypothetical protein